MKTIKKYMIYLLSLLICASFINAQEKWEVPEKEKKKISFRRFDDDMLNEGRMLYDVSCLSCHGNPTQADFTLMVPSPGDPGAEKIQNQTDGELFYKILTGRNLMPKFEEAYSEDEIWSIIAYFRSFNEKYKQPLPDLTGIYVPEYVIKLGYDDNVDKLVVKITDKNKPASDVNVNAYIKAMFGKFLLGKLQTNKNGIAYFDVDSELPGDEEGNLEVIVKATKGYAYAKTTAKMKMATPTINKSAIEGNHLWSAGKDAPTWIKSTFYVVLIGIWLIMLYVVFSLRKLKKLN